LVDLDGKKITLEEKITEWLTLLSNGQVFASHHIQDDCRFWIKQRYGTMHNAESVGRAWRELRRERPDLLVNSNIQIAVHDSKSREKQWRITFAS
jgi:hypothetical protein